MEAAGDTGGMAPRRGTSYGRAGTRWMIDPEAVRRPGAARARDAARALVITEAPTGVHAPRILRADTGFARMTSVAPDGVAGLELDVLGGSARWPACARPSSGSPRAAAMPGPWCAIGTTGAAFGLAWSAEPLVLGEPGAAYGVWTLHEIDAERAAADGDAAAPPPSALIVATEGAAGARILRVSDAFAELTEYPCTELIGADPALLQGAACCRWWPRVSRPWPSMR